MTVGGMICYLGSDTIYKKCVRCNRLLDSSLFYKDTRSSDGLFSTCIECHCQRNRQRYKQDKNYKGRILKSAKEYHTKHPEVHRRAGRRYYEKHKELCAFRNKRYKEEHIDKVRIRRHKNYIKKMLQPETKINNYISKGIRRDLKLGKQGKKTWDILDYTLINLKEHLESLFKNGMSWSNYGLHGWHIDHIRPISSFNFVSTEDEQFKQCWMLSNLQPLWAFDNLSKFNKIILRRQKSEFVVR